MYRQNKKQITHLYWYCGTDKYGLAQFPKKTEKYLKHVLYTVFFSNFNENKVEEQFFLIAIEKCV